MQPAGHLQEHERGEIELRMTKNKSRLKKITSREPYQTVSTENGPLEPGYTLPRCLQQDR